ncbi:RICIN domain-containing protein [Fibrella forsythiae]|uniref:RICIN domain-containing protein n=1 Tax=Fibrella forsythiae TaxID=2817061 RepID=A0ABS3JPK5_9BACT|nr:RICIN domain-containing protein [Fibrella forsythiae]MBO0951418.1 RICIN domain-containing protein [Fibrella forsythiae]
MRKHLLLGLCLLYALLNQTTLFAQAIKGTYAIKNVQTGMLLRVEDANRKDGTPIVLYNPVNWKCMTWDFQQTSVVDGSSSYKLKNLFTSKTLQPVEADLKAGVALEQRPLSAVGAKQEWEFIPVAANTYLIRLKGTQLYITPADEKGSTNSRVILTGKQTGQLQHWTIYEQHPTS